jgi:hypothetical protein
MGSFISSCCSVGVDRCEDPDDGRSVPGVDPRMHDALTDLYAYMLALDAERQRLGERVVELARSDAASPARVQLERRRTETREELEALRATIAALRAHADPTGNYL